jgi:signal transduction histidine kinase
VTGVGPRAEEVANRLYPVLADQVQAEDDRELVDLRWESDSLLALKLNASGRTIGLVLLGPKLNGEVFVEEEEELVATVGPLMALAVDQSTLSGDLRALSQRLLKAQEEERHRMAVDLHDGALQKAILLTRTDDQVTADPIELARELVYELREIGSQLRPSILDDLGLIPAIGWLSDATSKRVTIRTSVSLHGLSEDERFDSEVELALFRVTQETINNAVKHSDATRIEISLSKSGEELVLLVSDDGVGFTPSAIPRGGKAEGGVGLGGMRERVIQLNGTFEISSAPGAGTTILARVPARESALIGATS